MISLLQCSTVFLLLLCSGCNGALLRPFDVRIDQHKVDTIRDLIINTPRPRFSWKVPVIDHVSERNIQQEAYQFQLQLRSIPKLNNMSVYDTGYIRSAQSIHVPYTGDNELMPARNYRFRLRIWTTASEQPTAWTKWIRFRTSIFDLHNYVRNKTNLLWIGSTKITMNELRKEFLVPNVSSIWTAIAYISGIGYYELFLNGNKVDPSRKLDPGWTTYAKRTLLASFDLTQNMTAGMNAIGVKLGNGGYSPEQNGGVAYGVPRLLFFLNITFENGDEMEVLSDQTWTGREGSIIHDSIYRGEIYDSRKDRLNWTQVGFNDSLSAWIMPEPLASPVDPTQNGTLVLQDMPPIRAGFDALHFETTMSVELQGYLHGEEIGEIRGASLTDGGIIKPIRMWTANSDDITFDLGQNFAGWCRCKFTGPRGVTVFIRHAEILTQPLMSTNQSSGAINAENLHAAVSTEIYILRGDPNGEVYEPSFTYHGFRYLSIIGWPVWPSITDVECLVVHSETTVKGHFVSSNPIVNQIQHNIQWSQLSNVMSLPIACPQRDERLGWMGDAALSVDEALYNFDFIKMFLNFVNLIVDVQLSNGAVPNYVPGYYYPPDPNWGTALPTVIWQLYRHYGDDLILETYYDPIRAYVEYIRSDYNSKGLANLTYLFGDWVPPAPQPMTNQHLTASFGFLHDVSLLINMSQALGKTNDTQTYSTLYQQLAEEFHRTFYSSASNFYADGMQAAQILALALPNVVPMNLRRVVFDHLVNDINEKGKHVSTGIIATAQLYPLLSDNGYHDLALELVSAVTYPSYGFMFMNPFENATTLWESWNTPYDGSNTGSRNHIMFGSVGAWFYSHLAGIHLSGDMVTIRPRMVSESKKYLMSKINCQLSILYGLIYVSYTRDEHDTIIANSILLRVTIPPNTKARVVFEPLFVGARCATLFEHDQAIWSANTNINTTKAFVVEEDSVTKLMTVYVGSGQYTFKASWY